MRDLTKRMHTGIGAARALNSDLLAGERRDRRRDEALHRQAVILHLPAEERRAVIFNCQLVSGHIGTSSQNGAARNRCAAQEFVRLHRVLPGALQFNNTQSAIAAGNRQGAIEHSARRTGPLAFGRAQNLDAPAPSSSHHAPGNGDNPRQWSCTAFHGFDQSMRVSALSIFDA